MPRWKRKPRLDKDRHKAITEALKHYPVEDCMDAVRGWRHSPYHCGENATRTTYNELTLCLRDSKHIEDFRDRERGHIATPPKMPDGSDMVARAVAAREGR